MTDLVQKLSPKILILSFNILNKYLYLYLLWNIGMLLINFPFYLFYILLYFFYHI